MKRFLASLIAGLAFLVPPSEGVEVGGIHLPMQRDDLQLQGAGLLRKGFIFKIYVGALYLEDSNDVEHILSDVPKRIDIYYFHHTPKKYMIRAANEALKNNLTSAEYTKLLPKINQLHRAYRNGEKSSFASLTYNPGEGLTYSFDNKPIARIPCDAFANAYFSIWLGKNPSSKPLKKALLNHD